MRKKRIYVAPSANRKDGYSNRYFPILKKELSAYFDVLEADNKPCLAQGLALLRNSMKADVFLLSFVETIAFQKLAFAQYLLAMLALRIMRLRGKEIIFIFHNPKPHKGENWMSKSLTGAQLMISKAVISHSAEAAALAREIVAANGGDPGKVSYVCHPVVVPEHLPEHPAHKEDNVLIWGNILPYKGVLEFVSSTAVRDAGLDVRIVGKCKDPELASRIQSAISGPSSTRFVFENRVAGFDELADLVSGSRRVVFPYLPGSVSSSGVLIDTVAMGGDPVGPAVGAFLDLAEEGVCSVYKSETEMVSLLKEDGNISPEARAKFIESHSWPAFAAMINDLSLA